MHDEAHRWDATTARLIDFQQRYRFEQLDATTVHETKRRLIDTVGSALGAYDEAGCAMARAFVGRYRGDTAATVWGSDIATPPDMAAFANGIMARTLDISDTYLGLSRGHPSDMTPGLVAIAETVHADGRSLIAAISLAYDVYCSFCKATDINARGWDQPAYSVLGCAAGAAMLLGLSAEAAGHALSLAITPNLALAQARRGSLSAWKGCAGANAARNAVFAALLAKDGFTGPGEAFEGAGGLWHATGRFDWPLPDAPMIGLTHTKMLPICYHGQACVFAALDLRGTLDLAQIEGIHVDGYAAAKLMMGSDDSRWAPATRETADHSLPYCIAIALLDGEVTGASFESSRLADPAVAALMRKVTVDEDPALTAQYPEGAPGRVTVRMRSGETHRVEIRYPKGHAKNPMSDAEIEHKFRALSSPRLGTAGCETALASLWQMDAATDCAQVFALLAVR